ncbi:MAG: nuclear transport factor 2 family protein [Asgard group archaeon]|nr:nuclear transport factor 2 family protein [Asgard group archaeon]
MSADDQDTIRELVKDYIAIMEACDEKRFLDIWHPEARRFGLGNRNELGVMNSEEIIKFSINGLRNLKNQLPNKETIKFTIDKIVDIKVIQNIIAAVELHWHMILPGSKGTHQTLIHLAKHNNKWLIVNVLDKGFEDEI